LHKATKAQLFATMVRDIDHHMGSVPFRFLGLMRGTVEDMVQGSVDDGCKLRGTRVVNDFEEIRRQ
jgi:hypothetical protein